MGVVVQVFATFLICSLCMCMGIMFTWPSSTLRLFESANTTLHRPMTETELALFGSLSSVGALIGTPVLGYLLDRLGRKQSSVICSLLGVISWALVAASSRVEVLLIAVFVSGLSGAVFLVVPVYVSEICQESVRGGMTAGTMIFYGLGMLLSYLMGGLLSYNAMIYTCLSLAAAITAALMLLKESPTCLMVQGREEEAAKSLAFYRSVSSNSKEVIHEMSVIRRSLHPDMDGITPEEEKLNELKTGPTQNNDKLSVFQFIKKSASTRRALVLTLTLITAGIFQGLVVVQVYAEPLFEEAVPSMSATVGSILLAVVVVLACVLAAYLTERAGRRPLMIYASFATAASCLALGLQLHLKWGPNWLIAVNIYLFTITYSLSGGTVPYVLMAEVFLPEVRSFVSMLVIEWAWFCNSIILFIFNPLLKAIGLGPVFYIFATVSGLVGIYSTVMLPETKGLAVDEIQDKLVKRKPKNVGVY